MRNIEFKIAIRCTCNYSCSYCVGSNQKQDLVLMPLEKIEKIYNSQDFFSVTSFECGAGEPSLHPQIKDLIKIFLTKGTVSIPTNNSLDPTKWLPADSKKILIRAALHPQGEKDIDGFIHRLLKIKELGADARVEFVAHPERMDKIDPLMDMFKKHGIRMVVNGFMGTFNGKKYPDDYTPEQKIKIGLVHNTWYAKLCLRITDRNFSGIPCMAGCSTVYIDTNGNFKRCLYDDETLEEIHEKGQPCRVKYCGCGLFLEKLNTQDVPFWNYWRSVAGLPLLTNPNGNKTEDELLEEKIIIYNTLINRS